MVPDNGLAHGSDLVTFIRKQHGDRLCVAAAGYPIGAFEDVRLSIDMTDGTTSGATRRVDGTANAAYMTRADAATVEALIISIMGGS